MSRTNQVCICCEERDNCPHYDTRRTVCVPVKCTDWEDFSTIQDTTDWKHYHIQAAIAAMQSYISDGERMALVSKKFDYDDKIISKFIAEGSVMYADALIAELKKGCKQ